MTQQMSNSCFYKDQRLTLYSIEGSGLYTPLDFKIETLPCSTGCGRGYIMTYVINDNQLILKGFIFRPKVDELPEINGIKPIKLTRESGLLGIGFRNEYKNLNKKILFNGSLWLAKDFIESEYVHMGFQSPTAYKTVLKFDFENGTIVNVEDKSKEVEISRAKGDCREAQPRSMAPEDLDDWIMKRFSLDIDFYKKSKMVNNEWNLTIRLKRIII